MIPVGPRSAQRIARAAWDHRRVEVLWHNFVLVSVDNPPPWTHSARNAILMAAWSPEPVTCLWRRVLVAGVPVTVPPRRRRTWEAPGGAWALRDRHGLRAARHRRRPPPPPPWKPPPTGPPLGGLWGRAACYLRFVTPVSVTTPYATGGLLLAPRWTGKVTIL